MGRIALGTRFEDIFNRSEEADIDLTDENLIGESLDSNLDVPGADLDDQAEAIGAEDEENNYYSLGGDDHNDLDEDNNGNPSVQDNS